MDSRKTHSKGDVDFLRKVGKNDGPYRPQTGAEKRRAKRLVDAELLEWHGLDQIVRLTPRGRLFLRMANGIAGRADA